MTTLAELGLQLPEQRSNTKPGRVGRMDLLGRHSRATLGFGYYRLISIGSPWFSRPELTAAVPPDAPEEWTLALPTYHTKMVRRYVQLGLLYGEASQPGDRWRSSPQKRVRLTPLGQEALLNVIVRHALDEREDQRISDLFIPPVAQALLVTGELPERVLAAGQEQALGTTALTAALQKIA